MWRAQRPWGAQWALGGSGSLRAAAGAEGEETSPDGAGAEDERDAVGAPLKGVPDPLAGRKGEA